MVPVSRAQSHRRLLLLSPLICLVQLLLQGGLEGLHFLSVRRERREKQSVSTSSSTPGNTMPFLNARAILLTSRFVGFFNQVSLCCQVFYGSGFMGLDGNTNFLSLKQERPEMNESSATQSNNWLALWNVKLRNCVWDKVPLSADFIYRINRQQLCYECNMKIQYKKCCQ